MKNYYNRRNKPNFKDNQRQSIEEPRLTFSRRNNNYDSQRRTQDDYERIQDLKRRIKNTNKNRNFEISQRQNSENVEEPKRSPYKQKTQYNNPRQHYHKKYEKEQYIFFLI